MKKPVFIFIGFTYSFYHIMPKFRTFLRHPVQMVLKIPCNAATVLLNDFICAYLVINTMNISLLLLIFCFFFFSATLCVNKDVYIVNEHL